MPGRVDVDDHGQLVAGNPARSLSALLVPAVVLAVNGTIAWFMFLR
jgi:hypothetical protein